jgi:hypothetical protein
LLEEVQAFMKAARALFIWKAISGDSTAMRTGAERIGTERTGSEGTGSEGTGSEGTGSAPPIEYCAHMSTLGHARSDKGIDAQSALPSKADMILRRQNVRIGQ